MNKQTLKALFSTLLGFCIDRDITTLGEFLEYYKKLGHDVSKKIVLTK